MNQTHLYNGLFTRFPALLPPLEEQAAIADNLHRIAAKYDALISAAVTGQIDVREDHHRGHREHRGAEGGGRHGSPIGF